jgi:UDPglucose 6-dehydrogenase
VHLFLVGAGPVGLVTAAGFARLGHHVTVADIDAERIAGLRLGRSPIFEPGLDDALREGAAGGRLVYTTELTPPPGASFSIVCVGTPTGPDGPLATDQVERAVAAILAAAPPEHVVVVRSTLPVEGPARLARLVAARQAEAGAGGCAAVVTNPEFMREGAGLADFDRPSRVVTGFLRPEDRPAAEAAAALYAGLGAPTLVADALSVALVKLGSNVFLATKIAYANELARLCDAVGADVDVVTAGVGLDDRIGRAFLGPGPGYGGSCLPEQAVALSAFAGSLHLRTPVIDAAGLSNRAHQQAIVDRLARLLGRTTRPGTRSSPASDPATPESPDTALLSGIRIAVLGLAFKAGTDDVRESPALAIARLLREAGASVVGHDPQASGAARRADPALEVAPDVAAAAAGADAVVVATEWPEYRSLDWSPIAAAMRGDLVYDARNIVDAKAVHAAGLRLETLGRRRAAPSP